MTGLDIYGVIPGWRGASASSGSEVSGEEALRSFDAYFLGEMMKRATPSSSAGGLGLDGGQAGRMYRDFLNEELARIVAEQGQFGLADSLKGQIQGAAESGSKLGEET